MLNEAQVRAAFEADEDEVVTDRDLGLLTSIGLLTIQSTQRALSRLARYMVYRAVSRDLPFVRVKVHSHAEEG